MWRADVLFQRGFRRLDKHAKICYSTSTMRKLWTDKLCNTGKLVVHSKNCKWITVHEYWDKWVVETCWHEQWLFSTTDEALNKVQELTSGLVSRAS